MAAHETDVHTVDVVDDEHDHKQRQHMALHFGRGTGEYRRLRCTLKGFQGATPDLVFLGASRSWTRQLIPSNLTWHSIDTWIRSMFELTQLRCFTTVATELNFRRAAERLNMTQPPLSRQIQLLEHHLGVELFTRTTRSVALTAAGRAFFIEAQNLLERAQQAAATARRFAEGDIGSVNISFVGSAVYEFLPKVIAEARLKQIGRAPRLNSSHLGISYAVFCLKKKKK